MCTRILTVGFLMMAHSLFPGALFAQSNPASKEIPIERCDRLPIVIVRIGSAEMRFLVDTAATTMLNLKSFGGGRLKEIQVSSWSGTAATSAREVSIPISLSAVIICATSNYPPSTSALSATPVAAPSTVSSASTCSMRWASPLTSSVRSLLLPPIPSIPRQCTKRWRPP